MTKKIFFLFLLNIIQSAYGVKDLFKEEKISTHTIWPNDNNSTQLHYKKIKTTSWFSFKEKPLKYKIKFAKLDKGFSQNFFLNYFQKLALKDNIKILVNSKYEEVVQQALFKSGFRKTLKSIHSNYYTYHKSSPLKKIES